MSDLAGFLLARIAEDEAVARAVRPDEHLNVRDGRQLKTSRDRYSYAFVRATSGRVLAECEAKRRIIEWHGERDDCCEERFGAIELAKKPDRTVRVLAGGELTFSQEIGFQPFVGCVTLMMLALPYSEHPDYHEEWRP